MSTKSTSTRRFAVSSIASGSIVAAVIRQVQIFSDATYVTLLNETTVNNAGGYIQIIGIGFQPGCVVYFNNVLLSSTFISSTVVRATTPAVSNGSYVLLVANSLGTSNNASAIYVLSTSGFPTWSQTAYNSSSVTVSVQLLATGDAPLTYTLQAGSTLPDGTSLSSSGLLTGTITGATNGIVYSFVVLVDDVDLQTTQATISLTIAFSDTYYKNVTLLLNGETAVTPFIQDTSTNNYNLVINGDTKPIPFNPYQANYYSNYFDGTGDWLTAPASSVNSLANGAFTVEAWIFITGAQTQTYGHTIVGTYPGSGNGWVLHVNRSSGGPLGITWANGSPTGTVSITYNTYLDVGKWYHIAVVRTSTAASGLTIYLNGVSVATGTDATNDTVVQTLYVAGGNTVFGGGYITNVRIVKGVAVYTGAFTPPTSPLTATQSSGTNISAITGSQTSFLSCQSLSAIDNSVNSQTITKLGDTAITKFIPFSAPTSVTVNNVYSMFFDGTGDYLTTPSNAVFAFGTGDFTIEGWFYFTGTIATYQRPWGWSDANDNIEINASVLRFGGTNQGTLITGTTTILARVWYHIAVTRLSGVYKMWLNGVQEGGSATNSWNSSARQMGIGAYPTGVDPITGYISNLRVVKGIAVYTGTFTPSTTQLTSTQLANVNGNPSAEITGTATSLLTCQNSTLIDNSSNVLTLTPNADVRPINSITPFTQSTTTVGSLTTLGSAYCDGTGDYILSTLSPSITIGTSDFSMEAWGYWTTFNSSGTYGSPIISLSGATSQIMVRAIKTAAVSTTLNYYSYINSGGTFVPAAGYSSGISAGTLYINQWTHVAVSRQGSTWRMFINGVVVNTQTDATSFTGALVTLSLGIDTGGVGNGIINGYIEDARICVGTAAYINTFAPPVQPLTAITNTQLLTLQYNGGANNSGIIDNSPVNNIITRFGNTSQGTFSPFSQTGWSTFIGYGAYGYQSLPANTGYDVTGADFTIEFWANFSTWNTMGSSGMVVLGNFISTNGWYISWNGGVGGNLSFSTYNAGAGVASIVSTGITAGTNFQLGTWNHFTVMQKTNVIYFYLNGAMTYSIAAPAAVGVGQTMYVGVYAQNFSYAGNPYFYYSNLRIIKGTGLYSTAGFTPPTTPLTPIAGTTLLLGQSSNLVDNSGINATITNTVSGVAPSSQALSPFGSVPEATPLSYSNYFDGTGDYLSLSTNTAFVFGTGDFTFECWVNPSATSGRLYYQSAGFTIYMQSSGNLNYAISGGATQLATSAGSVPLSTWTHVAISRISGTTKIYINGVQDASGSDSNNWNSGSIRIGSDASFTLTGSISNLRVVKGVGVYTGNFTPPTNPLTATQSAGTNISAITGVQTSLLTCQSTTIIDNSTNAFTITTTGDVVPRNFNPFGYTAQTNSSYSPSVNGGSIYFDGTGDYLSIPSNSPFNRLYSTTVPFTIEFWMYATGNPSPGSATILTGSSTGNTTIGFRIEWNSGTMSWYSEPNTYPAVTQTVQLNQWGHYAFVWDGTNITTYLNGGSKKTAASSWTNIASTNVTYIATLLPGTYNYVVQGYLSNLRLVVGARVYTNPFITPTTPLTNYSTVPGSTSLLLNSTSGGIIDYHSSNVLETVGNAQLSTSIKLFGNASIYFDGTGDYLVTASSPNFGFGTGSFTIECWLYWIAGTGENNLLIVDVTGAMNIFLNVTSQWGIGTRLGSVQNYFGAPPTKNVWNHLAISRSGSTIYAFINGVSVYSGANSTDYLSAGPANIGGLASSGSNLIQGYIDDFRITKGFARYTGNFNTSPPISPAAAFLTQ
jgi:hypothetical protein